MKETFTQIDNRVLENLCQTKLWPIQAKVLFAIIRKTFGFHKEMDYIAQTQIAEMTKLDRRHVHRAMKELIEKNVICRDGKKIGISPKLYKKLASAEMTPATGADDKMSSVEMHTIDTNINIKIKSKNCSPEKLRRLVEQGQEQYREDKARGTIKKRSERI